LGGNQGGVLGNGTTTAQLTPKQVQGLSNIIQIDADINSSLALKSDGTVWSWGLVNDNIQYLPVQIPGLSNIIQISLGLNHGLALKNDGTVWAWGFNNYGQLGDGTKTNRFPPIKVQGISNIIAISAGYGNSLALASDGTVWAWGYNSFGQLGVNSTQDQLFPVKISGLSNVKSIYAGSSYFSMAIKMDGTVWAWGVNYYGQLGDGTKTNRLSPVQVSGLTNVVQIVAGNGQAFALKEDGSVWGWGYSHDAYPIGTGEKSIYLTPVKISHLNGIIAIATVGYHPYASISLALDNTKRIWAWGLNNLGQVGDGTTNPRLTPVLINRF
jgi:alpha-tubulin suppressor-like RCC1 family protein